LNIKIESHGYSLANNYLIMDLQEQLIESSNRHQKGAGKFSIASIGLHIAIVAFILFMSATATHKIDAETKPIHAFLASSAAPPPPPPPPPPPAASSAAQSTPKPTIKPVEVPKQTFVQPTQIPQELPKVEAPTTTANVDPTPAQPSQPAGEAGGVPGGVAGGVAGGVQGGVVGGTVGGQVGGTLGGVQGGVVGGTVGGTGSGEAKEAPKEPDPSEGPLRVGGDVKAPVVVKRVEPNYNDVARKAHVQGVVIVEAIIDKNGNVDKVKLLKGLSMGLNEAAEEAVKQWKFKPGTLNGEPVDVIFNLTVNFTLQ
jgi:protein TonB